MKSFTQVIALATPSRKIESLAVLLGSILHQDQILTTASVDVCINDLHPNTSTLVLIDHSISRPEIFKTIKETRKKNPNVFIVLLLSHPQSEANISDLKPDGIIYDGFSPDSLLALLTEPQPH